MGYKKLSAIEIAAEHGQTRVDEEFNLRVADVASEPDHVATAIKETFELFRNYIQPARLSALSYN